MGFRIKNLKKKLRISLQTESMNYSMINVNGLDLQDSDPAKSGEHQWQILINILRIPQVSYAIILPTTAIVALHFIYR